MDGSFNEDYGTGAMSSHAEGMSVGQRCQSVDSLAEWRSSEQLENGTPSTSPPFWDTDDDDCVSGPRPSELYGKFTWKIENYSQINKRELRSKAFEVGGYKWYILIYPQGCDVCNHLSLFLCVANHDKLLPGWSHFAQFTISVVNKDPNFSKFSDTLHRFWKKEHDWGWKKFMELTKVDDGFVNNETLLIKAQVQVIREKAHRPFRCLDYQYRRELLRVYLSNVEQICRRFFEDRKNKLNKLIDDKVRWSSFCSFWLGIDQNSRRCISRDKSDTILRVIVKHFFVEKEVTSTLVMDSLYSGLKALEYQSENKKERKKLEMEESAVPMVRVDKDMFVLADDVISLLDRVASEPLPVMSLPPKDGKVSQNRTKEGSSADDFNDSIERDERRLTELGRRTVEIFVLAHIFSRIEVAYQEAVALKRQEELIREEEAAGQAEHMLKAKRAAADKEKRTKKKQGKQKRYNRKNKEKQRDFKSEIVFNDKKQEEKYMDEIASRELSLKHLSVMNERMDTPEDASDISYNGGDAPVLAYPDLEDRDSNPRNWETDALELHPPIEASASEMSSYLPEKANLGLDDSSSTCSTDSVPSVVSNGTCRRNSVIINSIYTSPDRAKPYGGKCSQNHQSVASHPGEIIHSSPSTCHELEGDDVSRKSSIQWNYSHLVEKQEVTPILLEKTSKDHGDAEKQSNIRKLESSSASPEPGRKTLPLLQRAKQSLQNGTTGTNSVTSSIGLPASSKELPPSNLNVPKRSAALSTKSSHSSATKFYPIPAAKNITAQPTPISRPSSAPLIPVAPKPNTTVISTVTPLLSRSTSAITQQAADPSPSAPSYVPQSYRNAIMGKNVTGLNLAGFAHSSSAPLNQSSTSSSQSTTSSTSASLLPTSSMTRKEQQKASKPGLTFGSVKPEALHIHQQSILTTNAEPSNLNLLREPASTPPLFQSHGGVADEFPHLDIINDLLDEEQSLSNQYYHPLLHRHHSFNGRYSFPVDAASVDLSSGRFDQTKQYYDDNFLSIYSSSSGRAHEAQVDLSTAYANCQMDGLIQSTWPYSPADLSLINLGSTDGGGDGYSYQNLSDYPNLGSGLNGYGLYRP